MAAATVALGAFVYYGQPATRATPPPPVAGTAGVVTITVHISGAVVAPGLVAVAANARVADVIAAAGGTTAEAAPSGINLAAPVRDGEQVVVPLKGGPAPAAPGDDKVRLNSASAEELESIPGVGPVLAARILDAREARGGFRAVEDLLDVAGIGEAKLAALRDHVVIP